MTFNRQVSLAWGKLLGGNFGSKAVVFFPPPRSGASSTACSPPCWPFSRPSPGFVLGSGILASTTVYGLFLGPHRGGAAPGGSSPCCRLAAATCRWVIALLNSLSGLAAAAAGFVSHFQQCAHCCGGLGWLQRAHPHHHHVQGDGTAACPMVLFSGFGAVEESGGGDAVSGEMKAGFA